MVPRMLVGAHVSIAGGVHNAVQEAVLIGAQSFALFTGNQRSWSRKPLEQEECDKFKQLCKKHGFAPRFSFSNR